MHPKVNAMKGNTKCAATMNPGQPEESPDRATINKHTICTMRLMHRSPEGTPSPRHALLAIFGSHKRNMSCSHCSKTIQLLNSTKTARLAVFATECQEISAKIAPATSNCSIPSPATSQLKANRNSSGSLTFVRLRAPSLFDRQV